MTYTTIIFDFFGVFAPDVYPAWLNANIPGWEDEKAYYHQLALSADEGRITKEQFLQALADKCSSTAALVGQGLDDFMLNEPMVELLRQAAAHYKTALLCNGAGPIVEPIVQANGLDQYLQQIIFSSDVGIAKPDPQIYRLALKKLNSSADETIFIDDRLVNIEGANAVGITGVLYQDFPGLQAELAELGLTNLPLAVR